MKSQFNSLYDVFVNGLSAVTGKAERSLVNRLNVCERFMGEFYAKIKQFVPELDQNDRLDAESLFEILKYLLQYDRIDLWNPIDEDGNPDMDKRRLLGEDGELTAEEYLEIEDKDPADYHKLSDVEKLRVNQLSDKGKCGTNTHRLAQIGYGVGKIFLVNEGIVTLKDKEKEKLWNGEHDDALLEAAQEYHENGSPSTRASKGQDEDVKSAVDQSDDVPTIEDYENGKVKPSDLDSETLESFYEQTESTGKKSAITRELNKREREGVEA